MSDDHDSWPADALRPAESFLEREAAQQQHASQLARAVASYNQAELDEKMRQHRIGDLT